MKTMTKLSGLCMALALGLVAAKAQVSNVAMVVNIALSGFEQQSSNNATPVRITTKDILTLLSASTGANFSRSAQLVLLSQNDQLPTFAVRDKSGANVTTTDISSFLSITEATEIHANNNTSSYSAQTFNFDDQNGTRFTVSGLTTLQPGRIATRGGRGPSIQGTTFSSPVAGYGSAAGNTTVLQGTVTAGSGTSRVR
ncbi:MAG: hypothetical protein C5B50_16535 [Verrucomicrobia bacterium]|nr:MAG: hypothetical protein C5B50_16535 [Verrucomicrobiota bacterium]